ncbi:hypothetical protein TanjilG_26726 [Lupinus angustifolius]|uniref:Uncharacterized protein n=1 Tax=Lupinus angustifolius TaxID=3871 RepID=A0A1J7IK54_LUPAN|nr:hypothetical protein TanjilG_26726 [Lupinus angustifolius]
MHGGRCKAGRYSPVLCQKRAGQNLEVDNTGQDNIANGTPYFDPNEIFEGLGDLDNLGRLGDGHGFSRVDKDEYNTNEMLSTSDILRFGDPPGFLELIDLEAPLFWQTKHD